MRQGKRIKLLKPGEAHHPRARYPWSLLGVGDWFDVYDRRPEQLAGPRSHAQRKLGAVFIVRSLPRGGSRVRRVE